jgi:3-methylcrotonyl-CoA carboxylase beta subunit
MDGGAGPRLGKLENRSAEAIAAAEAEFKRPILEKYAHESSPYFATARLWDDGILDPAKTREALALAFSAALNGEMGNGR